MSDEPQAPESGMVADAGALLVSRVVVAAMGWAGTLLIVRTLSPSAWGEFSFVFNILALAFILTSAVAPRVAIRGLLEEMERGGGDHFAGSYVVLRGVLGLAAYFLMLGIVIISNYPAIVIRIMALAGVIVVISSISGGFIIVYQVHQQMRKWAVAQALGQAAQLVLTVALFIRGASVTIFTVPAIVCEVVILAAVLRSAGRLMPVRPAVLLSTWGELVRTAIPLAVGQGLFAVYNSIDSVMLSKLKTFQAVGAYGVAYKFSNIVAMVPLAMTAAIMGILVRSWPDNPARFWAAFRRSVVLLWILAVSVSVEFGVFAKPVVRLLYGNQYGAAAGAARLVVITACISFFTVLMTTALVAQGRNAAYLIGGGVGVVVNVAANLVAIPHWSYNGAAWVTLGTEIVVISVVAPVILRGGHGAIPGRKMATMLAAGAGGLASALAMRALSPWPVALGVSGVVTVALIHVLRIPGPEGLRSLMVDFPEDEF